MPTLEEDALRRKRQAYWLRTVRAVDPRRPTLADVARAAGLKGTSGSVVSLWENDVAREGPKLSQLQRLAAFYAVPLRIFTEPDPTRRGADRVAARSRARCSRASDRGPGGRGGGI